MLNETEHQMQSLELSMEEAKANVARYKTLHRLIKVPEFKEIILDGYFLEEASRLVLAKAEPNFADEKNQEFLGRLIDGVGALRQYFSKIERMGENSENALKEHEQTREELMQEQMEASEGALA